MPRRAVPDLKHRWQGAVFFAEPAQPRRRPPFLHQRSRGRHQRALICWTPDADVIAADPELHAPPEHGTAHQTR